MDDRALDGHRHAQLDEAIAGIPPRVRLCRLRYESSVACQCVESDTVARNIAGRSRGCRWATGSSMPDLRTTWMRKECETSQPKPVCGVVCPAYERATWPCCTDAPSRR